MSLYLVTVSPMVLFLTFCGCYKWRSAKSFLFPLEKIQISYFEKWLTQKSQKCVIKYMHSIRLFNVVLTVHPSSVVRSGENCKKLYFLNYFFVTKNRFDCLRWSLRGPSWTIAQETRYQLAIVVLLRIFKAFLLICTILTLQMSLLSCLELYECFREGYLKILKFTKYTFINMKSHRLSNAVSTVPFLSFCDQQKWRKCKKKRILLNYMFRLSCRAMCESS